MSEQTRSLAQDESASVIVPREPTDEMSLAGRKACAAVADRMEQAKQTAVSVIDFWQQVGRKPADEIYRAMIAAAPRTPAGCGDVVLMPREATREMTMAACDFLPSCEHVFGYAGEMLRKAYKRMVEVAGRSADGLVKENDDLKAADRDHLAARNGLMKRLEYALTKDSLTDAERVQSALAIIGQSHTSTVSGGDQ